jgi:dTDP-4-amino-4,6-dideoxygalactose transaminase
MNIPVLDLKRQYQTIKKEIDHALMRVVESGNFILGQEVEQFEKEVATYCQVKHAIGVASGTDALLLSLKAVGVGPGDRVIVPSFTFFATAGVVSNVGAQPVFADIEPKTFNIDVDHVKQLLKADTNKTIKAIIPVHLYGQMAEMDSIMELAQRQNLYVVEDAAQAIGAVYKGRRAGAIGHFGCFSFYPTKNLGAYGDGGLVTSNDDGLADKIRLLRVHGSRPKYYHHLVGFNSRLDAIQAAILRIKLKYLDRWSTQRATHAEQYTKTLMGIPGLATPFVADSQRHVFHQYTIRVQNGKRDALQNRLKEQGISTEIYYPLSLHQQKCFEHLKRGSLTQSEQASHESLSLPMFPELTTEERDKVCQTIKGFFARP